MKNVQGIEYIEDIEQAIGLIGALHNLEQDVLESPEFKLLYGKTQMFYDASGRSRGGHSYNIGQTTGSMASKAFDKMYGKSKDNESELYTLNKQIAEAYGRIMGYSHDLGHTPLGHDGESVLDAKLSQLTARDPSLRTQVEATRAQDFAGVKIAKKDGTKDEYEICQQEQRADEAKKKGKTESIGYEHNEHSAQIFSRIIRKLKEKANSNAKFFPPKVAKQIEGLSETKFLTAILAHSRSRFKQIPEDFLAQIVRQADKVEYMNYDFDEYKEMGFFPMVETPENQPQHKAFKEIIETRAEEAGVTVDELMSYLSMNGEDRRLQLEDSMISEVFDGPDAKGEINDEMTSMRMAKICYKFKDDALFYIEEDGKRGLVTGNNIERQEVILDRLLQYYVEHPDKIPTEPIISKISKLKLNENSDLVTDGETVVSFDPANITADNDYEKLKTYLSSLTNERCEQLYQQLVQERIANGPENGIEPVKKTDIEERMKASKEAAINADSGKGKSPYSMERTKKVRRYIPQEIIDRIQANRQRHNDEVEQDQALYEQMKQADLERASSKTTFTIQMQEVVKNAIQRDRIIPEDVQKADSIESVEKENLENPREGVSKDD